MVDRSEQQKSCSQVHDIREALTQKPDANLVVISVPGEYAAHETQKSLEAGKNVFLFSDNVSMEDEVALKRFASEHGLLVMGPDCGTSILGGVGIGFANVVRKGAIGVIAAAGTGLQESPAWFTKCRVWDIPCDRNRRAGSLRISGRDHHPHCPRCIGKRSTYGSNCHPIQTPCSKDSFQTDREIQLVQKTDRRLFFWESPGKLKARESSFRGRI